MCDQIKIKTDLIIILILSKISRVKLNLNPLKNKTDHTFYPNLNGLRFLGALMVFIFHCFTLEREIWGSFFDGKIFQIIYKIASKGHHGVGIFFVLSGFLISSILLNEIKIKGEIKVGNFLMRRILRIWPLYFLIVIFGFFIFPLLPYGKETIHSLGYYAAFLSNIDEIRVGLLDNLNFLTITWSVSIEEQFYLFWILLLACLPFLRKGKLFPLYFMLVVIGSLVFRSIYYCDERTIYFHTFSVMSDLALGGLMAYMVQRYSIQKIVINLQRWKIILIYIFGILLVLGSTIIFKPPFNIAERLCLGIFFAFILLEQAYATKSFFKLDKFPGFFKSGEITYGFYMYHCIFIYYGSKIFAQLGWTTNVGYFILYFIVVFFFTYLTAYLSFRFIEKPILGLKKYFRN